MSGGEWVSLGEISVDGGSVVVGDPGYVHGQLQRRRDAGDYSHGPNGVLPLGFGVGSALAFLVSSGFGDGGYEVLVRYTKRTKVVAEVRVVFVEEGKDACTAEGCQFGYVQHRADSGLLLNQSECASCGATGLEDVS